MISVEVTEIGVSLSKVASDMPTLAKTILKKAASYAKGGAELLTPVRSGLMRQSWHVTDQGDLTIALSPERHTFYISLKAPGLMRSAQDWRHFLRFQSGTDVVA
jgi:hypothetical protein